MLTARSASTLVFDCTHLTRRHPVHGGRRRGAGRRRDQRGAAGIIGRLQSEVPRAELLGCQVCKRTDSELVAMTLGILGGDEGHISGKYLEALRHFLGCVIRSAKCSLELGKTIGQEHVVGHREHQEQRQHHSSQTGEGYNPLRLHDAIPPSRRIPAFIQKFASANPRSRSEAPAIPA